MWLELLFYLKLPGMQMQIYLWNIIIFVFQSNVFMYYGLSNFYQNHRRYVKSRDDSQLNGDNKSLFVSKFFEFITRVSVCNILENLA